MFQSILIQKQLRGLLNGTPSLYGATQANLK